MHLPATNAPHSTWINSFTPTKLDALVLVEACLSGRLSSCLRRPEYGASFVASGFIFVYKHDAPGAQEIIRSTGPLKEMSVKVDGKLYHLASYYAHWDTVNGALVPPTRCLEFQDIILREEIAAQDNLHSLSPIEISRLNPETLGRNLPEFERNVIFLILSWTNEGHHHTFLGQSRQFLFLTILSSDEYWYTLSTSSVYEGKSPDQLAYQTEILLARLLWVFDGRGMPRFLEPSLEFSPLQNACLYTEAFGVKENPLGAFQPLEPAKLARALQASQLFADHTAIQPRRIESLDSHLRRLLPINYPRNEIDVSFYHDVDSDQEHWKEAEKLDVQVMEARKRVLGKEHPNTLTSINNLAQSLTSLGKFEEAEGIHRQALALRKRVLGKEHPDTLTSMNNLALVLGSQGKYEEAEGIHRQTLELSESVLGKKHPSTLTSMNNLAEVLRSQGKHGEAKGIHRQTLDWRESVLGKKHPDTLTSAAGLASTCWNQDQWEEAEGLEVRVMETRKRILGAEHPDTLASMHNLAYTWKSQNRNEEAISLMKECFELRNQVLGPEHPDTETSLKAVHKWESGENEIEHSG